MLKKINYFICSIILFELVSFVIGFGTHFDHYKYAIMISIAVLNFIIKRSLLKLDLVHYYQIFKKE